MSLSRLSTTLTRSLILFSKHKSVAVKLCTGSVGFIGCGDNLTLEFFMQKTSIGGWFDELQHSKNSDCSVSIEQAVSTALF